MAKYFEDLFHLSSNSLIRLNVKSGIRDLANKISKIDLCNERTAHK